MAARRLKPGIFVIARQNRVRNRSLFAAFGAEMTMVPSEIVAHECLASLRAKHLARFLAHAYGRDDDWAAAADRPARAGGRAESPEVWSAILGKRDAPGLIDALGRLGRPATARRPRPRPGGPEPALPALPLLLVRSGEAIDAPEAGTELRPGDEILYAGTGWARRAMAETLLNVNTADYVLTGRAPASLLGRLLERRRPAEVRS